MVNLKVELGDNSYPIFIGPDLLAKLGEMLKLYNLNTSGFIITDSNIDAIYGDKLTRSLSDEFGSLEKYVVASGEKSKDMDTTNKILTAMLQAGLDRNAVVIALGGGVVGDLGGFVASIYKRGIRYIQVPTTLLAQVDSSIGGKTGVNHPLGKNMIGTITQPRMVWSDLSTLNSLPEREILCGLGEIIKYGIIRDADLYELIERNLEKILSLDQEVLQHVVFRCSQIKADIVARDERESGLRMILNLGHTIGHALEASLGYGRISHGEGVLLGMCAEGFIADKLGLLGRQDFDRITGLINRLELTKKLPKLKSDELIQYMRGDKKAETGRIKFVLPAGIGSTVINDKVEDSLIRDSLDYLLN